MISNVISNVNNEFIIFCSFQTLLYTCVCVYRFCLLMMGGSIFLKQVSETKKNYLLKYLSTALSITNFMHIGNPLMEAVGIFPD